MSLSFVEHFVYKLGMLFPLASATPCAEIIDRRGMGPSTSTSRRYTMMPSIMVNLKLIHTKKNKVHVKLELIYYVMLVLPVIIYYCSDPV